MKLRIYFNQFFLNLGSAQENHLIFTRLFDKVPNIVCGQDKLQLWLFEKTAKLRKRKAGEGGGKGGGSTNDI